MPTIDYLGRAMPDPEDGLLAGLTALMNTIRAEVQVSSVPEAIQAAQTAIAQGMVITTSQPLPVRVAGRPGCTDGISLWWTGFRSIDTGRMPGQLVPASPDGQQPASIKIPVTFARQFLQPPEVQIFMYQNARLQAVPTRVTQTGFVLSVDNQTRAQVGAQAWRWSWLAIEL